jgi:hypothetical protein
MIFRLGLLLLVATLAFGQANVPILDTQVLLRAMQYASTFAFPVWLSAQDPHLARAGVAHDGEVAARLGLALAPGTSGEPTAFPAANACTGSRRARSNGWSGGSRRDQADPCRPIAMTPSRRAPS